MGKFDNRDTLTDLDYVIPCVAEGLYCPLTFDGLSCWNYTLAGETAILPCPYFVAGFDPRRKCAVRYFYKAYKADIPYLLE
jgi:hypothetical protein